MSGCRNPPLARLGCIKKGGPMLHMQPRLSVPLLRPLFVAAALFALAAQAFALDMEKQFTFDIPPQKLSTALLQFSHQAGVQVVVGPDVGEITTAGINGKRSI